MAYQQTEKEVYGSMSQQQHPPLLQQNPPPHNTHIQQHGNDARSEQVRVSCWEVYAGFPVTCLFQCPLPGWCSVASHLLAGQISLL